MKYRRKKGSALILMIAITMVLTIISGVMATSILNTTKLNTNSKKDNDLFYAAESGLEYAQAYFAKNGENMDEILWVGNTVEEDLTKYYSNIGNVKVTYKRESDDEITVTSEAVDENGKKKKISCTYNASVGAPRGGYMYEHSVMANDLDIVVSGYYTSVGAFHKPNPIDFRSTRLGYTRSSNIEIWNGSTGEIIPEENYDTLLQNPQTNMFKVNANIPKEFNGIEHVEELNIKTGSGNINGVMDGMIDTNEKGIAKDKFTLTHRKPGVIEEQGAHEEIEIYYINADKVYIEATNVGFTLKDTLIITNGEVIITDLKESIPMYKFTSGRRNAFSNMVMKFDRSSIIANSVSTYSGNFHCTYSIMNNTGNIELMKQGLIWPGTEDVEAVEKAINEKIPNWNPFSNGASGSPELPQDENDSSNETIKSSEWRLDESSIKYE